MMEYRNIKITNEDNMLLMARYPDNYFDLAIVDPPYGMLGQKYVTVNKKFSILDNKYSKIDVSSNYGFSLGIRPSKQYFDELFRVSKNQIIWGMQYFVDNLKPTQTVVVWDKKNGNSKQSSSELAWTSFHTKVVTFYKDSRSEYRVHPTQKPIDLYKFCLLEYAKKGDKILDTHLGSGSIAIACHDYGFELTACELDKEYFDKAMERINNHVAQQKLF